MSQRDSGYERVAFDQYETPEWVTRALLPHIPRYASIWEPACGSGKMVSAFRNAGFTVVGTDIQQGQDFLDSGWERAGYRHGDWIVTNPPYSHATEFIERALKFLEIGRCSGVAMLLRTDFDHAKSRRHLFGKCGWFSCKLVLTKRIQWFEDSKSSPSFNHAWFIWENTLGQPFPEIAYHFED